MMFERLSRWLEGETRLRVDAPPHEAASHFMKTGIPVYAQKPLHDAYECSVATRRKKRAIASCAERGWHCTVLRERGIRVLLKRAAHRPGIAAGLIFALILLFESGRFVWQIRIEGNEELSDKEILDILREEDFYVGCRYPSVDLHALCNEIPQKFPKIAWISVNMMGSVAEVVLTEYRERLPQVSEKEDKAYDLVASREGQIVRFELSCGRPTVSVGDTVEKGQLLAAGFSEKETGPVLRPSSGRIYARVVRTLSESVPLKYAERTAGEGELTLGTVNILGKDLIFFKKGLQSSGNYGIVYDESIEEYRPTVFGIAIPLTVKKTYLSPVDVKVLQRSREEAETLAKEALMRKLRDRCAEILSVSTETAEEGGVLTVRAVAVCIEDIAERTEHRPAEPDSSTE